jgi:hypothetical protein
MAADRRKLPASGAFSAADSCPEVGGSGGQSSLPRQGRSRRQEAKLLLLRLFRPSIFTSVPSGMQHSMMHIINRPCSFRQRRRL